MGLEGLVIRPMTLEDAEPVSMIEAECFSEPWSAAGYRSTLSGGNSLYLVAQVQDRIVGMCGVLQALDEGEINNVAVTKAMRGNGIAGAMLSELLQQGRKAGIKDFTLEVRVSNQPAIALYESLGFRSEGIRPGFYNFPKEDALIMWLRDQEALCQ